MTNGEKFKEVFGVSQVDEGELYAYVWLPNHDAAEISIDWWNAEYQEPTTKNDLGVEEVTALAEWTEKLTKECEEAYNKGYADGMKAQEPRKGHWIVQPSNKEQGERDFIWWKCSKCGQVIFSETAHDRLEFHAFCGRCGADMREVEE